MYCEICGKEMRRVLHGTPPLNVLSCLNCGFYSLDMATWKYPYENCEYYSQVNPDEISPEKYYIRNRVKKIRDLVVSGRVVDLGCGLGSTAIALARSGFEAFGVEESSNAITYLKQHYPEVTWDCSRIEPFLDKYKDFFDVISLYHVLEHIPCPKNICAKIGASLRPNGLLVIEVPDVEGGHSRWQGEKWCYWLPHHVNYFSLRTLRKLLCPLGFEYVRHEVKYHFCYPQGIWWKDLIHGTLAEYGLHNMIVTYWRKTQR